MARTDTERFTEAHNYLKAIDPGLAKHLTDNRGGMTDAQLGAKISLEGAGYWKSGTDAQHSAVRALMLCQEVYLKPPYTATPLVVDGTTPKFYQGKQENIVKEAILCYLPMGSASSLAFAKVAEDVANPNGDFLWGTRTRRDESLGANPVCFNAVRLWLFNAGFVSLRWLASIGRQIDAHHANEHLGDGVIITADQVQNIPRGYIFNFHVAGHKEVCHWGVSLGNGWAAGANTTASSDDIDTHTNYTVNFRKGNSVYGEFTLASSAEVCKWKYRLHGKPVEPITIRQIDPASVATYF